MFDYVIVLIVGMLSGFFLNWLFFSNEDKEENGKD